MINEEEVEEKVVKSLSEATGLSPNRIHNDRHPLDMD